MERKKAYIFGSFIAIGIFIITGLVGAVINAAVYIAFGYSSAMDAIMADNYVPFIQQLLTGIPLHIFGAKCTAKVINKVTEKYGCNDEKYYRIISFILFIFIFAIFPSLMGSRAGYLLYIVHLVAFRSFWKEQLSKTPEIGGIGNQIRNMYDAKIDENDDIEIDEESEVENDGIMEKGEFNQIKEDIHVLEENHITEVSDIPKICYCRKCGAALNEGAAFCYKCGTAVIMTGQELKS